jgi:hypothetical protein
MIGQQRFGKARLSSCSPLVLHRRRPVAPQWRPQRCGALCVLPTKRPWRLSFSNRRRQVPDDEQKRCCWNQEEGKPAATPPMKTAATMQKSTCGKALFEEQSTRVQLQCMSSMRG